MVSRLSDPRLSDPDPHLAMMIDLLLPLRLLQDLDFMFAELFHISGTTWCVPVDPARALRFEFSDHVGPLNIRLE